MAPERITPHNAPETSDPSHSKLPPPKNTKARAVTGTARASSIHN